MAYRLLPVDEARAFVLANGIITTESVPPEGLLVTDGLITVLVFRKTSGELILIDVTESVPPQFSQAYPAPVGFWEEVARRIGALPDVPGEVLAWAGRTIGRTVGGFGESVGGAGLLVIVGIALGILLWRKK